MCGLLRDTLKNKEETIRVTRKTVHDGIQENDEKNCVLMGWEWAHGPWMGYQPIC